MVREKSNKTRKATKIKKDPSKKDILKMLADNFVKERYGIRIEELSVFYGLKLCTYHTHIKEYDMKFIDAYGSQTVQAVTIEMAQQSIYNFEDLNFNPGDVVIDIGANVGMVSIYLAKRYPYLKIYAYEPIDLNFRNFKHNIAINKIPQEIITPERFAVNGDGTPTTIATCIGNTGGSRTSNTQTSNFIQKYEDIDIPGITLQQIIEKHGIKRVKLLKIDCEGAEYDILKNCPPETLAMIENIVGEFHGHYDRGGEKEIKELIKHCKKYIPNVNIIETDFPD